MRKARPPVIPHPHRFILWCLTAGIAVVREFHRQEWASLWTGRGYRLHQVLDPEEVQTRAIWHALPIILEKVRTDRGPEKPEDSCCLAVISSNCTTALQNIWDHRSMVAQKMAAQSIDLHQRGIKAQLYWVSSHKNRLGDELADLLIRQNDSSK